MMVFLQTWLGKILIWQKFSYTWESDFKGSWLYQNDVGDKELTFLVIEFISKQLYSQKQWTSNTSNML